MQLLPGSPLGRISKICFEFERYSPSPLWHCQPPARATAVSLPDSWASVTSLPASVRVPAPAVCLRGDSDLGESAVRSCGFLSPSEQTPNLYYKPWSCLPPGSHRSVNIAPPSCPESSSTGHLSVARTHQASCISCSFADNVVPQGVCTVSSAPLLWSCSKSSSPFPHHPVACL